VRGGKWSARRIRAVLLLGAMAGPMLPASAEGAGRAGGTLLWEAHARRGRSDRASDLAVSQDGSTVFVTGEHDPKLGQTDWATLAYDATTGHVLWGARRGSGEYDHTQAIAASPDGNAVFVVGSQETSGDFDWATAAYDARTGTTLWYVVRNASSSFEIARDVVVSPDGSVVYVIGEEGIQGYISTVAYSTATGSELWAVTYDGPVYDEVFDATISPNASTLLLTGGSYEDAEYWNYATVAYDARSGSELWVAKYAGSGHLDDRAFGVRVSPDGSKVYVTGHTYGSDYHFGTFALAASTGAVIWYAESNGTDDEAVALAVSPDESRLFVTGLSESSTTWIYDYLTIAYGATTGSEVWRRRFDTPWHESDYPVAVETSPDGSKVFVTGYSNGRSGKTNYVTIAYAAGTGRTEWLRSYDGHGLGGRDEAVAMAVSPTGSGVFVTGRSVGGHGDFDIGTIAYEP
jgi:WD40 repeat protein